MKSIFLHLFLSLSAFATPKTVTIEGLGSKALTLSIQTVLEAKAFIPGVCRIVDTDLRMNEGKIKEFHFHEKRFSGEKYKLSVDLSKGAGGLCNYQLSELVLEIEATTDREAVEWKNKVVIPIFPKITNTQNSHPIAVDATLLQQFRCDWVKAKTYDDQIIRKLACKMEVDQAWISSLPNQYYFSLKNRKATHLHIDFR